MWPPVNEHTLADRGWKMSFHSDLGVFSGSVHLLEGNYGMINCNDKMGYIVKNMMVVCPNM